MKKLADRKWEKSTLIYTNESLLFSRCPLNDDPNSVVDRKWVDFFALLPRNILFFSRSMVDNYWEVVAHTKNDEVAAWFGNTWLLGASAHVSRWTLAPSSGSLSHLLFSFSSVCSCSPTVSSLFVHEYSRSSAEPGGRRGGVVDSR